MHLSCKKKKKKLTKRDVLKLKEDSFAAHGLAVTFAHCIFLFSKIIKTSSGQMRWLFPYTTNESP